MGGSGKKTIMTLAGVYLAYVGGKLFMDAMREKPGNYVFMMIMGVIFVIFGLGTIFTYMRDMFKHEKLGDKADQEEKTEEPESLEETEQDTEVREEERKQAVYVDLSEVQNDGGTPQETAGEEETGLDTEEEPAAASEEAAEVFDPGEGSEEQADITEEVQNEDIEENQEETSKQQ